MNADDEKLLQQLGRVARAAERAPEQVQLDKLSAGELPRHELVGLQAASGNDAVLRRALATYEPLGSDTTAQIAARVLAITRERDLGSEEADPAGILEEDDDDGPRASVVPLHGRSQSARARKPSMLWVGLPLCAAAAALLWFGTGSQPIAALPAYQLLVSGGEAEVRSAPGAQNVGDDNPAPVRVGHATTLHLVVRPETATSSDVSARVYLAGPAHAALEWPAQVERAPSGALQLVLAPPPAAIDASSAALIVIGDSALITQRGAELASGQVPRGDGFQRWRIPLIPGGD